MVYTNVLEAMGNTPMIKLSRLVPAGSAEVLVKYRELLPFFKIKKDTAAAVSFIFLIKLRIKQRAVKSTLYRKKLIMSSFFNYVTVLYN